jgi:putative transposase
MRRVVAVGVPHHITQRGNARQDIFVNDSVCRVYLNLLREHARVNHLRILAYCLMTNHAHIVAVPEHDASLANTFRHAHARFAQYWNTQFHRDGHLWQNRFYSCPVEDAALWRVIAYVERNPLRARIVPQASDYPWSSAPAHLGGHDPAGLLDLAWWSECWEPAEWQAILAEAIPENAGAGDEILAIRRATYTGRPFGSDAFVEELGRRLGRRLDRQKGGRPRKSVERVDAKQVVLGGAA